MIALLRRPLPVPIARVHSAQNGGDDCTKVCRNSLGLATDCYGCSVVRLLLDGLNGSRSQVQKTVALSCFNPIPNLAKYSIESRGSRQFRCENQNLQLAHPKALLIDVFFKSTCSNTRHLFHRLSP